MKTLIFAIRKITVILILLTLSVPDVGLIEIILEDKFYRDVVLGSNVVNLCSLIYNNTV